MVRTAVLVAPTWVFTGPAGADSERFTVLAPFVTVLSSMETAKDWLRELAGKVSVPLVATKSTPLMAVPAVAVKFTVTCALVTPVRVTVIT